jgi:hypothetical protein
MIIDATKKGLRFYTVSQLSGRKQVTPEGFLLCLDVVIARTGEQLYGAGEIPVDAGPDGRIKIHRAPEDVFRPETIASFNGKPVVIKHPEGGTVNPDNWNDLAVGVVMHPRGGLGAQDDSLIADLLITSRAGIDAVNAGLKEVSCGYDADYDEISEGVGRQYNIVGNHVALVENARCGPRCSIRDEAYQGEKEMKTSWKDVSERIRKAFKTNDCDSLEKVLKEAETKDGEGEGESGGVHLHMGGENRTKYTDEKLDEMFAANEKKHGEHTAKLETHDAAIAEMRSKGESEEEPDEAIEGELEEEAPAGTGDMAKKAMDSKYLDESFKATVAMAEVIHPGIKVPTFDAKSKPGDSFAKIDALRRVALAKGLEDAETSAIIKKVRGGRTLDAKGVEKMSHGQVRELFFSVGAAKKEANNARTEDGNGHVRAGGGLGIHGKLKTPADLNKRLHEVYKQ